MRFARWTRPGSPRASLAAFAMITGNRSQTATTLLATAPTTAGAAAAATALDLRPLSSAEKARHAGSDGSPAQKSGRGAVTHRKRLGIGEPYWPLIPA